MHRKNVPIEASEVIASPEHTEDLDFKYPDGQNFSQKLYSYKCIICCLIVVLLLVPIGFVISRNSNESFVVSRNSNDNSVRSPNSMDGSVSSPNSKNGSVSTPNSKDSTVSSPNSKDGTVSSPNSKDGSVSTPNSKDGSVSSPNSKDGSVSTPNSKGGSVSTPNSNTMLKEIVLPPWLVEHKEYTFPHPTEIKGKSKEAYAFSLCSRKLKEPDNYLEAGLAMMYRLRHEFKTKRDLILAICPYTPIDRYEMFKSLKDLLDIIVVPVEVISPPLHLGVERWLDACTKFVFFQMINWDRIIFLDLDLILLEGFEDIWNEPQTQLQLSPPSKFDPESEYLGFKIKDLYPYIFAASIDSTIWKYYETVNKLNAGMFVMRPSLIHFELILRTAFNASYSFPETDQTMLNFIYKKEGPLPWQKLSHFYNYYPVVNRMDAASKTYHYKLWEGAPAVMNNITGPWTQTYNNMKRDFPLAIADTVIVQPNNTTLTLSGLRVLKGPSIFYALLTTKPRIPISREEILKDPNVIVTKTSELTIGGLLPNKIYTIYYFGYYDFYKKYTQVYLFTHFTVLKKDE
jgi:alpha-N-acetylglucosamine transferase